MARSIFTALTIPIILTIMKAKESAKAASPAQRGGKPMYKSLDEIPVTFGPAELASILGISRNKAYELTNRPGFPKYRLGKKIIISKKHFIEWMDEQFGDGDSLS